MNGMSSYEFERKVWFFFQLILIAGVLTRVSCPMGNHKLVASRGPPGVWITGLRVEGSINKQVWRGGKLGLGGKKHSRTMEGA